METLPNGLTLEVPPGVFPLGTDSMALAHFAKLGKNAHVLDLGSGCGTLGLLLCAREAGCTVTGVELENQAHLGALANIRRNGLEGRMESICGDLRLVSRAFPPGSFSCCVCNPPYFSSGPASGRFPAARGETCCSLADIFTAAAWSLKFGGDFFLVHRPERLEDLLTLGRSAGFAAKRLGLLRHRFGEKVSLVLLAFRKGGKPGLLWEDWILREADGSPTRLYREIYHQIEE